MLPQDHLEWPQECALAAVALYLTYEPQLGDIRPCSQALHRHREVLELFSRPRLELAQKLEFA